ncbi:unnamed protein product, partial [marine sediment metagenome]
SNCTLYINNTVNETDSSITRNITQNLSTKLGIGDWTWNVNCSDSSNNTNVSETRTLKLRGLEYNMSLCGGGNFTFIPLNGTSKLVGPTAQNSTVCTVNASNTGILFNLTLQLKIDLDIFKEYIIEYFEDPMTTYYRMYNNHSHGNTSLANLTMLCLDAQINSVKVQNGTNSLRIKYDFMNRKEREYFNGSLFIKYNFTFGCMKNQTYFYFNQSSNASVYFNLSDYNDTYFYYSSTNLTVNNSFMVSIIDDTDTTKNSSWLLLNDLGWSQG